MKISVIMIDGGFRENPHAAKYFSNQRFESFEIIWVEYYDRANKHVEANKGIRISTLGREGIYHSSYCFNEGVRMATGELLVIVDADQIVAPDFLSEVWRNHIRNDRLVMYCHRYDERHEGCLSSFDFGELDAKCELKNPANHGGCLTVRKRWLEEINGYEQISLFRSGNHSNGSDVNIRLKNLGLEIAWNRTLKLYHPWHPFTLQNTPEHKAQKILIAWRSKALQFLAFDGMNRHRNDVMPNAVRELIDIELKNLSHVNST